MTTAINVANYIATKKHLNGEMQLQKLLYYVQAWSLVWDGRPAFEDRIEAWKLGPVLPSMRFMSAAAGNADEVPDAVRATVDAVLAHYGRLTGGQLGDLSHTEDPWSEVWEQHSVGSFCNEEISHNAMRRFYTLQALKNDAPKRRMVEREQVDDAEVLATAAANSQIWSHTLELLAQ